METRFKDWKMPKIHEGKLTKWNWLVQGVKGLKLGYKTDIGAFTYINATEGVVIGDRVQIGSHVSIYSINTEDNTKGKVIIKSGARIGAHSVILPNVTIGANAVIGAFALVKDNIPDNAIALGIPAKVVNSPYNQPAGGGDDVFF